jgi:hypothetical protein
MNLFILDTDPVLAARMNCDSHVCKIILEAADMLCLAHWETGGLPNNAPSILTSPKVVVDRSGRIRSIYPYRAASHANNHVSVWVRTSLQNYRWTSKHALALCDEYEERYADNLHKRQSDSHASRGIVQWLHDNPPDLPDVGITPFRQAVAREPIDCYVQDDPVSAYKLYYNHYKRHLAKWRLGNAPSWFGEHHRE